MKNILLLLILAVAVQVSFAQDEAIYSHYHITPMLVTPAYAGFSGVQQINVNARMQWTGFTDSPKTYNAAFNTPIGKTFGIGLSFLSESAAQLNRSKVQLNTALRFGNNEEKDFQMAVGFSAEFQRVSVDNDVAGTNFFQGGDELLNELLGGRGVFDASLGFYGTYRENTYAGLTFSNLVRARLDDIVTEGSSQSFLQYYLFMFGHTFDLIDANFTLEPSVMVRQIRNSPFQVDFNLKAGFLEDQLMAGLSYRSIGALGVLLGTKLEPAKRYSINLYYSYDVSFQRFQKFNMGSHELTLVFELKKKDRQIDKGY